jgi:hypothetical protein
MRGIKINDPKSVLDDVKLKLTSIDGNRSNYVTENGNSFIVTIIDDKVVSLENGWLLSPRGNQSLFSNFQFTQTSFKDICKKLGSNGFTYKSLQNVTYKSDTIVYTFFEFDSPNNEVLMTRTRCPQKYTFLKREFISDSLKVDAVAIADKKYLDNLWGKEKIMNENSIKIKF